MNKYSWDVKVSLVIAHWIGSFDARCDILQKYKTMNISIIQFVGMFVSFCRYIAWISIYPSLMPSAFTREMAMVRSSSRCNIWRLYRSATSCTIPSSSSRRTHVHTFHPIATLERPLKNNTHSMMCRNSKPSWRGIPYSSMRSMQSIRIMHSNALTKYKLVGTNSDHWKPQLCNLNYTFMIGFFIY